MDSQDNQLQSLPPPSKVEKAEEKAITLPFEQHAADLPAWELAAVRASQNWAAGREVTEAQFQDALEDVRSEVIS
jgi:hypothetical protein